jgi:hypothetical protein
MLHRQLSVPLRQTNATMGPQIHQAPGGRNSPVVPQKVPDHEKSYPRGHEGGRDRGLLQRIQRLGLRPSHITEGTDYLRATVPGSRPLHHRRRASSGPHRRSEACARSTTTRYEPATRQTLGEEASRRSSRHRTTRLSRPGEDLVEANTRWMTSSTPSAHTTRICATPFGTAETSSTPSGTADPSNLYLLLRRGEDQENRDNPSNRRREEVEPSRASTERSTSSSADTDHMRTEDNKSSTIAKYWWRPPVLALRTDGRNTRSLSPGQISGSTSTTQANTRSSSIR